MTEKRLKTCEKKIKYKTLEEAKKQAWWTIERNRMKGDPQVTFVRAYGCSCGSYHVGRSKEINWEALEMYSNIENVKKLSGKKARS